MHNPKKNIWLKIARALLVALEDFFTNDDDTNGTTSVKKPRNVATRTPASAPARGDSGFDTDPQAKTNA